MVNVHQIPKLKWSIKGAVYNFYSIPRQDSHILTADKKSHYYAGKESMIGHRQDKNVKLGNILLLLAEISTAQSLKAQSFR